MRPRFVFDFGGLLADARLRLDDTVDGVEISLPFLTVRVVPREAERLVARDIALSIADRRFLSTSECCLHCRASALASLHEIERMLVCQQGLLSPTTEAPLHIVIQCMIEGIRQFAAFEQTLGRAPEADPTSPNVPASRWSCANRRACFSAMEMLRAHLWCCLRQVEAIAEVKIASVRDHEPAGHRWPREAYKPAPGAARPLDLAFCTD